MCSVWSRKFHKVMQNLRCGSLVKFFFLKYFTECNSALHLILPIMVQSVLLTYHEECCVIKYHLSLTLRHLQDIPITIEKYV